MTNYHHITYSPIIEHNKNLWLIDVRKNGVYLAQMNSMLDQLEAVLTHYSQVLVVRFDIGLRYITQGNEPIRAIFESLLRYIQRTYKISNIGYHWVREQEKSKKQHYHCVLMLDANKIRHPSKLNDFILKLEDTHHVRPWIPKNCFYRFKRNELNIKQGAIIRMSYLAKGRGKGYKPTQVKNHSSSRVKPKC